MRYTEARLTAAAMEMVASIDEDTVDFIPNYDGSETQPEVLPAGLPNLLVNGASGIAVGMATNMAPHNLGEVIAAARHLLRNPSASLDALMRFVPGPDLPTGGRIVGLDGIREAYETGRGIFRTRATAGIEQLTPRRTGIVVTELPYTIGPEKVMARIKDLVQAKKLNGIADLKDLTDRNRGLHLVIEVRSGFNPDAVLAELYRLTPMEETFGINNVALVDGQPRVLGLRELLEIYVAHRLEVIRRRTEYRRRKRAERLHLVDGLLIALLNIDEVIQVIRSSDDAAAARERLMTIFELSQIQAQYILDTPLRRLTRYDRLELEREQDTLRAEIAELTAILESDARLRELVSDELAEVAKKFATPRRTVLLEGGRRGRGRGGPARGGRRPVRGPDVGHRPGGPGGRRGPGSSMPNVPWFPPPADLARAAHDVLAAAVRATVRGTIGVVTSAGRLVKVNVLELPALPPGAGAASLAGGHAGRRVRRAGAGRDGGGAVRRRRSRRRPGPGHGRGRGQAGAAGLPAEPGRVRADRAAARRPGGGRGAAVRGIGRAGVRHLATRSCCASRRPRCGRRAGPRAAWPASGCPPGASVVWFGAVDAAAASGSPSGPPGTYSPAVVVTVAGQCGGAAWHGGGSVKVTPLHEFPAKGRATGGVRCHRFLKGEDALVMAWAGPAPAVGATDSGSPVILPDPVGKRDGSGIALRRQLAVIGGAARVA